MDVRKIMKDIAWIKPWSSPRESGTSGEALALLRASQAPAPTPQLSLPNLIAASKRFPLRFPIHTVRMEKLQSKRPVERLLSNAESTYAIMHERVVYLIANFLLYKRQYGSSVEKQLYKDMTIEGFIDRLLLKRAATFMKAQDQYKLVTGESGTEGWEAVGTDKEKSPLVLANVLSYDEMKISALVCVSGRTECINDGARRNAGVECNRDIEQNAVIIGIIGPRFKRAYRMEYEDILVTREQNTPERGYGRAGDVNPARRAYRRLWDDFYEIPSVTYDDITKEVKLKGRGAQEPRARWAGVRGAAFDNLAYARRLALTADVVLLEADARAQEHGTDAFVNVIGAGLGIWKHSIHQIDVFVLLFVERVAALLDAGRLNHVADVNFAFIEPKAHVLELFTSTKGTDDDEDVPKLFIKNSTHPKGGINVQLQSRSPSARLRGAHAGKLLVLTYPWDSNAHPGNEFWIGKLSSSGDSAAACATQVTELHNAHVNPSLRAAWARVAGEGVRPLRDFCAALPKS